MSVDKSLFYDKTGSYGQTCVNEEEEDTMQDIHEDMIRCDDGTCVYYIPRDLFAHLVLRTQYPKRKYVRYQEGAEIYGMSLRQFKMLSRDAGAVSKINKLVLVDTEIMDKYIGYFREK